MPGCKLATINQGLTKCDERVPDLLMAIIRQSSQPKLPSVNPAASSAVASGYAPPPAGAGAGAGAGAVAGGAGTSAGVPGTSNDASTTSLAPPSNQISATSLGGVTPAPVYPAFRQADADNLLAKNSVECPFCRNMTPYGAGATCTTCKQPLAGAGSVQRARASVSSGLRSVQGAARQAQTVTQRSGASAGLRVAVRSRLLMFLVACMFIWWIVMSVEFGDSVADYQVRYHCVRCASECVTRKFGANAGRERVGELAQRPLQSLAGW